MCEAGLVSKGQRKGKETPVPDLSNAMETPTVSNGPVKENLNRA